MRGPAHRLAAAVAAGCTVLVLAALLWPDGYPVNRSIVWVYATLQRLGVPAWVTPEHYAALLNVLAFVPLGWLGVVVLRGRPLVVLVLLVALSVSVELVQSLPAFARDPSVSDVLLNSTGAALGVLLGWLVTRRRGAPPPTG